jgi:Flp pilus assembly protein TadB
MGLPEFAVVLSIALPVLIVAWVLRAAHRFKAEQQALRARVDVIERALRAR